MRHLRATMCRACAGHGRILLSREPRVFGLCPDRQAGLVLPVRRADRRRGKHQPSIYRDAEKPKKRLLGAFAAPIYEVVPVFLDRVLSYSRPDGLARE